MTVVALDTGSREVTMRLRAGAATLSGVVVTEQGQPIPSAAIDIANRNEVVSPDRTTIAATADAQGRFSASLRKSSVYVVTASARGYRSDKHQVALARDSEVRIVVFGTATLTGIVRMDQTGAPVPRSEVTAYSPATFTRFDTSADGDGRFAFEDLPPGDYFVMGRRNGYRGRTEPAVHLRSARREETTVYLRRGLTVSGEVVATDGTRPSGVQVTFTGDWGRSEPTTSTMTTWQGGFKMGGLAPGKYVIFARPFDRPATSVQVTLTDDLAGLAITLLEGATITGTVFRGDATTCAGAEVKLSIIAQTAQDRQLWTKREFETDARADGSYELPSLPPGKEAHLVARCQDDESAVVEVGTLTAGGSPTIDIRLDKAAVIAGQVVGTNGAPTPGALVMWSADVVQGLADFGAADANGRFRITLPARPPGMDVLLHANGPDVSGFDLWRNQKLQSVRVAPGVVVANLVLELR